MSADVRRLTTDEERERLYAARHRGGMCAVCGRALNDGEPVFWEQFAVGRVGGITHRPQAPVASECASSWLRQEKEGEEPGTLRGVRPARLLCEPERTPQRGRLFEALPGACQRRQAVGADRRGLT